MKKGFLRLKIASKFKNPAVFAKITESNPEDVKYAYELTDYATKKSDEFSYMGYLCLLNGTGFWRVGNNFDMPHNHRAVVDAFHLYQKNNPETNLFKDYEFVICRTFEAISAPHALDRIVDILNYELTIQESGKAALPIDFNPIVEKIDELKERNKTKHIYGKYRARLLLDLKTRAENYMAGRTPVEKD